MSGGGGVVRQPTVRERARGLMHGIAVGNLLGIPYERGGRHRALREARETGRLEMAARKNYPDDDDLAQAIVLAEAAACGPLDIDDLGRRFWVWAEENGLGMGGLTGDVLRRYSDMRPRRRLRAAAHRREDVAELERHLRELRRDGRGVARTPRGKAIRGASRRAANARKPRNAGNGAAMRCSPLAIRWMNDADALVRNTAISASATHWFHYCGWSCAMINLAVAHVLTGERDAGPPLERRALFALAEQGMRAAMPELSEYGYSATVPSRVAESVKRARGTPLERINLVHPGKGFTLLAMEAALSCYWHARDFESGMVAVVAAKGDTDTDTNGAVAGAMLGARFGIDGIPRRWIERAEELREGRTPMTEYADSLLSP